MDLARALAREFVSSKPPSPSLRVVIVVDLGQFVHRTA